jgi:predicted DNA-binding protein
MTKLTNPQDDYVRTAIRLPPELHSKVKAAAKIAGHTMNAELIARIAAADNQASHKLLLKQNEELRRLMLEMLDRIELLK